MRPGLLLALLVAVSGQVLYQLMVKNVSHSAHPVLSLLGFYAGAAVLSLPLFWLFPLEGGLAAGLARLNWPVLGVSACIVLVELGFLLAYRHGGALQSLYITSASVTATALLAIGALAYGESVTASKLAGLALALAGIWLLSRPSS